MNITDKKILNATQLQRTKEMRRLAETKLSNIEENLEQLRKQQVFLRRYNKLKLDLKQEKERLFELNKQQASMANDIRQLERYEMSEAIQGTFQRVSILEKLTSQNNRSLSILKREGDELNQSWSGQEKLQAQMQSQRRSAEERHHVMLDNIFHALTLQGFTQACEAEIKNLAILIEKATQQMQTLECNSAEVKQDRENLTDNLALHRAKRQGMEIHESTIHHAERILLLLDNLQDIEEQQKQTKILQTESLQKQEEENRMLEKVFSQYQEVTSEIEAMESELQTHKSNILGQDSYKLQERAMQLKSLKQMLVSAQSLWHQISVGYRSIEEKVRTLNELRLHIENTERNIREMETEVGKLSRLCHEKEHTYLLSKGQNIIQLRADLKEGVSCSVCGATHHPYHSDTMLDQSKLIGEFKTDYELLSAELRGKRKLLDELRLDLAESKGRHFSEESSLNAIRIRQNDDVKEWGIYASLDPSFKECSPSTNLDARMALIRHMIESTGNDAEEAQKELDTFNRLDQDFLETICAELSCAVNPDLREYIATNIIPRYSKFDEGHAVSHVTKVMERALALACRYDVNPDMVFTAAAYHDLGIKEDRKTHNIISARMVREDSALCQWFTPEQIDIIADAAEDHRASLGYEPRTIYGKITAEADRLIFPDIVVERCIQYGRAKHPELDKEGQWERVAAHLEQKYGRNGYLKVWLPESSNAVMLEKLRDIIDDKIALREMFDKLYR